MRSVRLDKYKALQQEPSRIRNICIMAHVDHGKTTLADSLLATNGIISKRLAGKMRYMDSRKDEQERGITMKSSAISLCHTFNGEDFLINLIDSPGHVDFSSEVSTAVRLCDGAIIVIDVVEGLCAQTVVALRQAWQEKIRPVLILNKIDRLVLEVKLSPLDAYLVVTQVLEKVNVEMAKLFATDLLGEEFERERCSQKKTEQSGSDEGRAWYDWNTGLEEADDTNLYFSPEQGNVVFASAADGWGFRISDFANMYAVKIGVSDRILGKTLWGDFYLNQKLKRIMSGAQEKAKKPLFVQLVLENIWAVYEATVVRKDKEKIEKIVGSLGLSVSARDLKQNDGKAVLSSLMSSWLPLSNAVLGMVCGKLPSPLELSEARIERLMISKAREFKSLPPESQKLKSLFMKCDSSENAPVIAFVSKMIPVDSKSLPQNRPRVLTMEEIAARREEARQRIETGESRLGKDSGSCGGNEVDVRNELGDVSTARKDDSFVAFARVFSGTLRKGSKLYILGPKHDPVSSVVDSLLDGSRISQHVTVAEITELYLLMGRELEALDQVPAGNILGIGGLEDHILKTGTVSSTLLCPPFTDLNLIVVPILRVALEPYSMSDMNALTQGLKLLNQADPCVQVYLQESGEHVLVTAGEVHLQRCLDDLRERYAKVRVNASEPIVPFRETIIEPPKLDMVNELIDNHLVQSKYTDDPNSTPGEGNGMPTQPKKELIVQLTANKKCRIMIRARPLPSQVIQILDDGFEFLKLLKESPHCVDDSACEEFRNKLLVGFKGSTWEPETVNRIWSFGPKKCGPNILVNWIEGFAGGFVWSDQQKTLNSSGGNSTLLHAFESNFVNGFQLATLCGPLCEEPMRGVGFIVEEWVIEETEEASGEGENNMNKPFGPFSGQIMSAMKEGCRKAFQAQPQRLMVAMYSSNIQVNSEVLGRLYAVVGKRGGRILHGDLQEGSSNFEVTAQLPVVESFDFANEVRRQTSGLALPQLIFSGWEVLEVDPFWQPRTEEEYLHFGEKADTENRARKYMNMVRRRKGLRVEEKLVEFAEKQRTLTKNK